MDVTLPSGDLNLRAQVVIVGAGAGGCVAALTLAEAGLDVIVLEDGHTWTGGRIDLAEATRRFYAEAAFRISNGFPSFPVVGGRGVGGSTLVNSALCFRTPAERVDEWNAISHDAIGPADAYFAVQDALEATLGVAPTPEALLSGNDRTQRAAARRLGWSEGSLRRNTPSCTGCGRCNQGCPTGGKNSADRAFLPRATQAGARVFAGCRVEQLAPGRVGGRIRGPDGAELGAFQVLAEAVVLSGGAVSSPRLLLDSGLVDDGGEVGAGLRVQPVISALGYFPDRVVYASGATQGHFIDEFAWDDTIFEANPTVASFLAAMPTWGEELHTLLGQGARWANTGMLIRDTTDGRVRRSNGSKARVDYQPNEVDRARLERALLRGAELWFDGGGAERVTLCVYGAPMLRSMDEARRTLKDLDLMRMILYSSHPQASCRLGRALDETGQVLEADGVFVMDASVLPSNVGRNPQISVMTVARLLAERLAEQRGGRVMPLDRGPPLDPGPG